MKDRVPGEAAAVISTCFTSISSQSMGLCFAQPSDEPVPLALLPGGAWSGEGGAGSVL